MDRDSLPPLEDEVELLDGLVTCVLLLLLGEEVGSREKNGDENRDGADLTEDGRELGLGELDLACFPECFSDFLEDEEDLVGEALPADDFELLEEVDDLELNRDGINLLGEDEVDSALSALFDFRDNGFGRILGFDFDFSLLSLICTLVSLLGDFNGNLLSFVGLSACSPLEESSGECPRTERLGMGEISPAVTWHTFEVALGVDEYNGLGSTEEGLPTTASFSCSTVSAFSFRVCSMIDRFGFEAPSGLLKQDGRHRLRPLVVTLSESSDEDGGERCSPLWADALPLSTSAFTLSGDNCACTMSSAVTWSFVSQVSSATPSSEVRDTCKACW